jgi:hypothetical protein
VSRLVETLYTAALKLPGAEGGIACAGTALETRTAKVKGKAFLFLRAADLRLKLGASLPAVDRLAGKHPDAVKVGTGGWVWVALAEPVVPPATLKAWMRESHALFAAPKGKSAPR